MKNKAPLIWVLADDRAGNVNQAIGVAEALKSPFQIKEINYNKYAKLPNFIRGASLLGVELKKSSPLDSPWPDIVIGAGRKTAPIARYIKKRSKNKSKLIQLMWPGFPSWDFDIIATPQHDEIATRKNVINTVGAPNRIAEDVLKENKVKWEDKFAYLQKPLVALLIGGNTKEGNFTEHHAAELTKNISLFLQDKEASLLITNSRRTSQKATEAIKKQIKNKFHFHDCNSNDENPYFGYLALSDIIIASGDSISMCSEACSTGKPVYIYAPEDITPKKHKNFHANLYKEGFAKPLSGQWEEWSYKPLNDAKMIAEIIRKNYF